MFLRLRSSCILSLLILAASSASAQVQTGTPAFGSFGGGPDVINLGDLNAHIGVPVLHKPGRGTDFTYDLSYDTSIWYPVGVSGSQVWTPVFNWGWRGQTEVSVGYVSRTGSVLRTCRDRNGIIIGQQIFYANWVYHDPWGTPHKFTGTNLIISGTCGSGAHESFTETSGEYTITTQAGTYTSLYNSNGESLFPPVNSGTGAASRIDRNGNKITIDSGGHLYDTLSTTVPVMTITGTGTPASPIAFTYNSTTGSPTSYTMKFATYTIQTAFGCSGVTEYGANGTTTASLVSEIDLPDNAKYTFSYEPTPGVSGRVTGRLASVRLPTGGTISYMYSGGSSGHITCADGSAATLSRQTPDGTWKYERMFVSGTQWQTVVTDPTTSLNQTSIQFQGIYETQRRLYQGSTNGTLLQTVNTCYNGAGPPPCTGVPITLPILQRTVTATIPGSGNLQSQHTDKFDSYQNVTESDDYDFATAAPFPLLRQTLVTYASLGANLNAFRQTATVKDGWGTIKSRQDTNYDQYSSFTGSSCITGAPNHDDSGHGCSFTARANPTSTTTYTDPVTPSGGITKNFTYDSLGNLRTAQLNCCQLKTWAYSSTPYAYPDSVTSGSSSPQLTTSATYDLNMGLVLTSTDPNSVQTILTYDNMGRTLTAKVGTNPPTNYTYNDYDNSISFTPWTVQVCSPVQGSNTACQKTILDNLGRPVTTQLRDGSGTLYSARDTQYDALGRAYKASNPYTTAPSYWTQVGFDVLGRTTSTMLPDTNRSII